MTIGSPFNPAHDFDVVAPNRPARRPNIVSPAAAWQERTELVKREVEAERAASNAKTARLKALRLAKEAVDKASFGGEPPKKPAARRRIRRIIG